MAQQELLVECPECGQQYTVGVDASGSEVRCQKCRAPFRVPQATQERVDAAAIAQSAPPPDETRTCPFCSEPVGPTAGRCRHCGQYLPRDRGQTRRTSAAAVASLVSGVIGLTPCCVAFPPFGLINAAVLLTALVLGLVAKHQIAASDGELTGRGMATAGLIIGIVGLAILCLLVVLFIVFMFTPDMFDSDPSTFDWDGFD